MVFDLGETWLDGDITDVELLVTSILMITEMVEGVSWFMYLKW